MAGPTWRRELKSIQPYQPGKRASEFRSELGLDDIVKLSSNESHFGPTELAQAAMMAAVPRMNRYPDSSCRVLRAGLARFLGVDETTTAVGSGSNELIRLLAQVILSPGDEAVMAKPSFVVYPIVTHLQGATPVEVPTTKDWRLDLAAIQEAITRKTKIVFLANPNNPTGTIYTKDEFDAFIGKVPKRVLVVVDEAYFEFVDSPEFPNGLDYFEPDGNVVVLRTFSKIHGLAGLRVGYGVVPAGLIEAIDRVREPFNVNSMAQIAAYASLKGTDEIESRRQFTIRARDRLCEVLGELGLEYGEPQGNFVFVKVEDGQKVFKQLLSQGVIVRAFGDAPFVRITLGSAAENDALIDALRAVFAG